MNFGAHAFFKDRNQPVGISQIFVVVNPDQRQCANGVDEVGQSARKSFFELAGGNVVTTRSSEVSGPATPMNRSTT